MLFLINLIVMLLKSMIMLMLTGLNSVASVWLLCAAYLLLCVPNPLRPLPAATSNAPNAATCLACARTLFPKEQPFFHSPLGEWKKVRSLHPLRDTTYVTWSYYVCACTDWALAKEICAYAVLRVVPAWYHAQIGRCALTCDALGGCGRKGPHWPLFGCIW